MPRRLAPATRFSVLARSRTWSATFAGSRANPPHSEDDRYSAPRRGIEPRPAVSTTAMLSGTPAGQVSRPGIGPGPGPSEGSMRSTTPSRRSSPTRSRTWTRALGKSRAIRYTIGTSRAGDWNCTSICRFTKPVPSGIEPRRRQARARGVEPRPLVLEANCSPRSTLVMSPQEQPPAGFINTTSGATSPAGRSSTTR